MDNVNDSQSRYFKDSPEILTLIDGLVNLYINVGSLNKLAGLLSDSIDGRILPNRLKPILSSNPKISVNRATFETIREAVDRAEVQNNEEIETGLREKIFLTKSTKMRSHNSYEDLSYERQLAYLAEESKVPYEVVKWFGPSIGLTVPKSESSEQGNSNRTEPDWTFQDDAYESCMNFISNGEGNKWGLVVPTGGGKTRIAIRVALGTLMNSENDDSIVLWVTHRNSLKKQAEQELRRALEDEGTGLDPAEAVQIFRNRFKFRTIQQGPQEIERLLEGEEGPIELIIVDEAHHGAAQSYNLLVDQNSHQGLFLTATPNRTDQKAIGIDEIAYEITYAELFDRGVILKPNFIDDAPFVKWSNENQVRELARYLLEKSKTDFVKTMVVCSHVENVEILHKVLLEEFDQMQDCSLFREEIVFIHGGGNSGIDGWPPDQDTFLELNAKRDRGILISTSGLLGEGFDDKKINTVVITYATESIINLMQSAGRALRWHANKSKANVVQVRETHLQYFFDELWLYQDISDALKPRVARIPYSSSEELVNKANEVLIQHNVLETQTESILNKFNSLELRSNKKLMLYGRNYAGPPEDFNVTSKWLAKIFESREVSIFNNYCALGDDIPDRTLWLKNIQKVDKLDEVQEWNDVLHACQKAREEIRGATTDSTRGFSEELGTTWLKYYTFQYVPHKDSALEEFFYNSCNKVDLFNQFAEDSSNYALALRLPHPLEGTIGFLLSENERIEFETTCMSLTKYLHSYPETIKAYQAIEEWRLTEKIPKLPGLILHRIDHFLGGSAETDKLLIGKA